MQLYSLIVITIIFPYAVRYLFTHLDLKEFAYIALYIYGLALFTIGYPLVATLSLLHVTYLFITDYLALD